MVCAYACGGKLMPIVTDIMNNDTIYLRFSSFGKICDPWAMSTSELRAELKSRNAYETKLQPEQLVSSGVARSNIRPSLTSCVDRCFGCKNM